MLVFGKLGDVVVVCVARGDYLDGDVGSTVTALLGKFIFVADNGDVRDVSMKELQTRLIKIGAIIGKQG